MGCGTDGWADGQADRRMEWNQYAPQQLRCVEGIINISINYIQPVISWSIIILVQSIWGQNGLNPPQIATKIKLAPCCRGFCEDFRKQKFTKINRVEHFQIAQILCELWGKILKKIGFSTFYQYGQIHVYFKSVWFMFVIKLLKTLYGRTNVCWTNYSLGYIPQIGRFYEKHPSLFLTATHSFSYNLAIIQLITFADGLKPAHNTSACDTACRRYSRYILMDTFWFISIIVTPTPKIVKLRSCQNHHICFKTNYLCQLFLIF